MRIQLLAIGLTFLIGAQVATAGEKTLRPVVMIAGTGNATIGSNAGVFGGSTWAVGSSRTTISKHDQTMEMAQDFLRSCPAVEVTLDGTATPDYYAGLNREDLGTAYNIGQSQVMVLKIGHYQQPHTTGDERFSGASDPLAPPLFP